MRTMRRGDFGAAVGSVILAAAVLAQPLPPTGSEPAARAELAQGGPPLSTRVHHLDERLAALRPARPGEYLELAEEVAAEASLPEEHRLGQQLFALAFELARSGPEAARQGGVRVSALLGLAEAVGRAGNLGERRWVLALARAASPAPVESEGSDDEPVVAGLEPGALEAATALDMVRNGEGHRAEQLLRRPGAVEHLDRVDKLIQPNGLSGGVDRVRRLMAERPICPECHNRRAVKDKDGVHLCGTCGGRPGPTLSQAELVAMVRTEAVLMNGTQLSWASQALVDDGSPLRDLSAEEVAPTFGVNAARPFWHEGGWAPPPVIARQPAP